jgi:crotonobetainyl-CoA:carnitine CoA-transferase CaiB-like acyl-CoA transferase
VATYGGWEAGNKIMAPLEGLRVVEVALGVSAVGAGLAGSLPGGLLRDLGAEVTRVQPERRSSLDTGVEFARAWDRDKEIIEVSDTDPACAAQTIVGLARDADVLFLVGDERLERGGLRYWDLTRSNPRLVVARIRPSYNALGPVPDIELLVQARSGLLTQVHGHRPGPAFCDLAVAGAGAGLSAAVGALACLYEREETGLGGWAETSLYDGIQAILPNIIGRVEHQSPSTTLIWKNQGPAERLAYRCADGECVQLWFGAQGAYEAFLEHMSDPPSERGYFADMVSGALAERDRRWAVTFGTRDREWWLTDLAGQKFRCEPVLRPAEALRDPHVIQVGLSLTRDDPERGPITVLGPALRVAAADDGAPRPEPELAVATRGADPPRLRAGRLLEGVRVLDLSAYLAGPVTTRILAGLGADVVKVEPPAGDVHRAIEPMFAAGQLGKRAMTLDMKSPHAPPILERLFRWSDVVHHNSRVGLAERLGYDEATVRAANPEVIYSFASGFGQQGPRAQLAANDQLMQALSGVEAAQGGEGQPPAYQPWGAIDVTSGWMAACGVLAALYARRRRGGGQSVAASLLGAALTLKSGAFLAADRVVSGPTLDAAQTGYGAAYRIYAGRDGAWFALAVPDTQAWGRLRDVVRLDGLPAAPPPLRTGAGGAQPEEALLEAAFRTRDATDWVAELRAAGVPAEPVIEADRSEFAAGFVDDPVNRQLGRVATHHWGHLGRVDQPCFPPRLGPAPRPPVWVGVPGLGEHTAQVLDSLGFDAAQRASLAASGTVREV